MERPLPDFYDRVNQYQFDKINILQFLWAMYNFICPLLENQDAFKKQKLPFKFFYRYIGHFTCSNLENEKIYMCVCWGLFSGPCLVSRYLVHV